MLAIDEVDPKQENMLMQKKQKGYDDDEDDNEDRLIDPDRKLDEVDEVQDRHGEVFAMEK